MIIFRLVGGLGNQMFQYACAKAVSLKKGYDLKFDITHLTARYKSKKMVFRTFDLEIFNLNVNFATKEEILKFTIPRLKNKYLYHFLNKIYLHRNIYIEKEQFCYDPDVFNKPDNYYYAGYWQSYKYFEHIAGLIKKEFSFKYPLQYESLTLYKNILDTESVCINFRRTDYLTDPLLGTLIGDYGNFFYEKAVEIIASKVNKPVFYVFSDDINWCKKNVQIGYDTIYVDHTHAGKKFSNYLKLMTSCKYFIIPNSSFAWWAAWLGGYSNKIVIAPKKWANLPNLKINEIIPNDWIVI